MDNVVGSEDSNGAPSRTVPLASPVVTAAPLVSAAPSESDASQTAPPAQEWTAERRDPRPRWAGLWRWRRRRRGLDELRVQWTSAARVPLSAPVRIVVASPKGGVGKTTTALGLGEALAALRAERLAVLDAEPLGGTAGLRVKAHAGEGLPGLLGDLDDVEADGSYIAWARYATIEHETRVTVFGRAAPLEGAELRIDSYHRIVEGLARQWPIVIVDTGRPEGRDVLQAEAVGSADVLIVVCGPGKPTVDSVAGWLRGVRVPPERRVGVVVARTGGDPAEATALMASHTSGVVHVPVDPALDADAPVPLLQRTQRPTRDALLQLAALVMQASQVPREERE